MSAHVAASSKCSTTQREPGATRNPNRAAPKYSDSREPHAHTSLPGKRTTLNTARGPSSHRGKTRPSSNRNTLTIRSRTLLRQQQRRTRGFQAEDGRPPMSSESGLPWLSSSFATSSQKSALSARWARGARFIAIPHPSRAALRYGCHDLIGHCVVQTGKTGFCNRFYMRAARIYRKSRHVAL